jgi:hypothetical protein
MNRRERASRPGPKVLAALLAASAPGPLTAQPRTHEDVLREIGPRRRLELRRAAAAAGLPYPPLRLTLVGLKEERVLEAWGKTPSGWRLLKSYPVLAASGGPGPKRQEGDLQVPEGIYRLTAFNPRSSYHLSIRVDYPNADDRAAARLERRTHLGGDIYIHGRAVSIGCLAVGDPGIEEVYTLVADVGLARSRVVLAPGATPTVSADSPAWVLHLYDRLRQELRDVRGGGRPP